MSNLTFSTKAKTLEDLAKIIKTAKILPVFRFTVEDFENNQENIINSIQKTFENISLVIRSSAKNEDSFEKSNAGHFKSLLNVPNIISNVQTSIKDVISAYDDKDKENEILIQPMLENIEIAGVLFTADIDTLAPYYIINYDESGKTDSITSGTEENTKTYIQFKNSPIECKNKYLSKLINTCKELETLYDNQYLDIEFAFDKQEQLYILQVRPITVKNKENLSEINLENNLLKIYKKIEKLSSAHPNLLGSKAFFGVMPDWNPAEIIGIKPRQLSLSLYKELVTDNIWAFQRDNYGYRNLRSHPLLVSFLGTPFVDIRTDFNSFIPKSLNENIAQRLVEFYLNKLASSPAYHDKIEFKIVHSCYYLNLPDKLKELLDFGFNENEIRRIEFSLLDLTNKIIDPDIGHYKNDLEKIEILKEKYDSIINSELSTIDKIYWLIENCKRYGTLPFAGIARAAFIAVQFLKSFVEMKIITQSEYDCFMNSLNTVSKGLTIDLCKLSKEEITKEEFLAKYGHLRPGTYDILSLRYDENFDNYFSLIESSIVETKEFCFNTQQIKEINKILIENGIKIDAQRLISFIKEAIEGREYSKFIFTQSLSTILTLIEAFSKRFEITREEISYLDIKTILNMYATLDHRDVEEILKTDIQKNKEFYRYTKAIKLPSLIINPEDIYGFYLEKEEPNYITLNAIEAQIIKEENINNEQVKDKIVFIKSADPGYDFLFTKNIGGLVTQFGGANSHMAIRCAELGIPAVIGAGEKNFVEWSNAKILNINCATKQVRVIL